MANNAGTYALSEDFKPIKIQGATVVTETFFPEVNKSVVDMEVKSINPFAFSNKQKNKFSTSSYRLWKSNCGIKYSFSMNF